MLGGIGAQSIIYSCGSNPVELTDNVDLEFAKAKVGMTSRHFILLLIDG